MKSTLAVFLIVPLLLAATVATAADRPVRKMPLLSSAHLSIAQPSPLLQIDSTLTCFEGFLSQILNVGCFVPQSTTCTSGPGQFLVQYMFPNVGVPHQVLGFGFLSNDAETVFPSGGVLLIPFNAPTPPRWPTELELANLQVHNISSATDTSIAFVDLESENLIIQPGSNVALVVALEFPASGELLDVGIGPGIVCDGDLPDQDCDFFTLNGGVDDNSWFAPCGPNDGADVGCPENPPADPLDWGFVVLLDPILSVESATWTQVKTLYRTP